MRRSRFFLSGMALAAATVGGHPAAMAQDAAAPPAAIQTLSCDAPFGKNADEAALKDAFGDANVVYQSVTGAEGEEAYATVVYPNDPSRRVVVYWWDEETRQRPATVQLNAHYDENAPDPWATDILWQTREGLRIGAPLDEVQEANGKTFTLSGFGWDYGGVVTDWNGGALATQKGGCTLSVTFSPSRDPADAISGDVSVKSDAGELAKAAPRITRIAIGYPEAQ